jgi:hypothetical protein
MNTTELGQRRRGNGTGLADISLLVNLESRREALCIELSNAPMS